MTPADPAIPPRLLRTYRQTDYRTCGFRLRIGHRAPDALFARIGAHVAVLVTAWHPRSRRMPPAWNRRMQRRLRQRLRRFAVVEAQGALRRWCEAMLLVSAEPRPVIRLARQFRQHGVVVLRRGQAARLVLLRW
jgi:hypothetical protein